MTPAAKQPGARAHDEAPVAYGACDERVLLHGVSFRAYAAMRELVESPGVQMTYLEGTLEITSPSAKHEITKTMIARLLEVFALERDVPLFGYGSTTFRREERQRGLEPDECYTVGTELRDVPDIAIEVVVTAGGLDELEVYRGLGVREVWRWKDDAFELFELAGDRYVPIARSRFLPDLDLAVLAEHAHRTDQHAAIKAFRDRLRAG
jgi:Uma2 family endonuclease